MPWLSVYENVALAVNQVFRRSKTRAERRDWIEHNLRLVNMEHAMDKLPGEISGGTNSAWNRPLPGHAAQGAADG